MLETATDRTPSPPTPAATERPTGKPSRVRRIVRGRADDPAWVRPTLVLILTVSAVLYLWDLGASGWANDFYAAAVQSGTKSWTAFFFGSSEWGNVITVDKPPAALWVMALSGRIFGFSSWSMLAPQALMGVASVWLLYAAVRRWSGPAAGLVAAALLAITPVAVLMFRFNNPDALLVLLMIAAAYCVVRALDAAATRAGAGWLALAGAALGFAFLTKTLQSFLVLPPLALVYLVCAPTGLWRRIWQLLVGGLALVVSAGWYILATILWPADSRPYIGGSGDNTELGLAFGYNGLDRVVSGSGGGPGGGMGGGGFGGATGITRLFNDQMGTQIAWFLPAALIALVAGLWITRRAPRTDRVRAALILWGGWLLVTAGIFSYMEGIFHSYYNVALAPGVAAVLAVGGRELWRVRDQFVARVVLAGLVAVTAAVAWDLLGRAADWNAWLRWVVLVAAVLSVFALLIGARGVRQAAVVGAAVGAVAVLAGPAAYAVSTAGTPHNGSTPTAGPAGSSGFGGPGGGFMRRNGGEGAFPDGTQQAPGGTQAQPPGGTQAQPPGGSQAQPPGGSQAPGGAPQGSGPTSSRQGGGTNTELVALLKETTTKWAAAAIGSQSAAGLQLESDKAVIPIGGFSGGDPAPTLEQFKKWVAEGKIHYFIGGGMGDQGGQGGPTNSTTTPGGTTQQGTAPQGGFQRGGGPGGNRGTGSEISTWVAANFTATTVGNQTVYDLTKPTA